MLAFRRRIDDESFWQSGVDNRFVKLQDSFMLASRVSNVGSNVLKGNAWIAWIGMTILTDRSNLSTVPPWKSNNAC
jgi:hypothetical protein